MKFHFLLLGFLSLFFASCSPKTNFLERQWINLDCYQQETPLILDFKAKNQVFSYDAQFQNTKYTYQFQKTDLYLFDSNQTQIQKLRLGFINHDSLVLFAENSPEKPIIYVSSEQQFRSQKAFRKYLRTWEGRNLGVEKTLFSLLEPLQAETVEMRVNNLAKAIEEGEYLATPTLFLLMNLKPEMQEGERQDATEQRRLVSKIWRITKKNGVFRLELENQQAIETTLPIYQSRDRNARPKTILDLRINPDASAQISALPDGGLKIDIDGVRVGKGWFKIGIPPFVLRGNKGEMMGFEFSVLR